jgi:hypothetical protein
MNEGMRNSPSRMRRDQVCREQELGRILGRVYAILLDLAEKETADSGYTADKQDPEPAVTEMTLLDSGRLEDHREHSTP